MGFRISGSGVLVRCLGFRVWGLVQSLGWLGKQASQDVVQTTSGIMGLSNLGYIEVTVLITTYSRTLLTKSHDPPSRACGLFKTIASKMPRAR